MNLSKTSKEENDPFIGLGGSVNQTIGKAMKNSAKNAGGVGSLSSKIDKKTKNSIGVGNLDSKFDKKTKNSTIENNKAGDIKNILEKLGSAAAVGEMNKVDATNNYDALTTYNHYSVEEREKLKIIGTMVQEKIFEVNTYNQSKQYKLSSGY